jgi:hypothetical protein
MDYSLKNYEEDLSKEFGKSCKLSNKFINRFSIRKRINILRKMIYWKYIENAIHNCNIKKGANLYAFEYLKLNLNKYYNITKNSDDKIATGELYSQFKDDNLTTNITNRNFGKFIKFNKVGLKKSNGKRYYTNIVAKEDKYNI